MKHKHIDVVDDEFKYLRLRLPPSKNHKNPITTMPTAVSTYLALKKYHKETNGTVSDEDYVFLPEYGEKQRGYALKQLQRQFEVLMSETKLGLGSGGENRTIYSLRHTSIMFRLLYGDAINTLALARNARTSYEMIDRFYAKPLTGEMNIEMLQSRRRRRKYFDGEVSDLYGSNSAKESPT
jgi:integrase